MKLAIDRRHIEPMMQAFPRLEEFRDQLRFGNRVEVPFSRLEPAELDMLQALYAAGDRELRAQAAQIATLRTALASGGHRFEAEELEMAVPAMARYLAEDAERGWVFSAQRLQRRVSDAARPLPMCRLAVRVGSRRHSIKS
jgi:hypothetical protein